jgi:hypothetical protein
MRIVKIETRKAGGAQRGKNDEPALQSEIRRKAGP